MAKKILVTGATGFIGEQLSGGAAGPRRPIEAQLQEDLVYLKRLAANLAGLRASVVGGGA